MSINNKEELQRFVILRKSLQIIRCKDSGSYSGEMLYDAQWGLIDAAVKRNIGDGDDLLNLLNIWGKTKSRHRNDFIKKLKTAHKEYDQGKDR